MYFDCNDKTYTMLVVSEWTLIVYKIVYKKSYWPLSQLTNLFWANQLLKYIELLNSNAARIKQLSMIKNYISEPCSIPM